VADRGAASINVIASLVVIAVLMIGGLLWLLGAEDEVADPVAVPSSQAPATTLDDVDDAVTSTVAADPSGAFEAEACPFDQPRGYDITCGTVVVPENRSDPDTASILLAVAIVHAPDGGERPPVLYLAGGPGGSGLDDFASDPEGWDYGFLETRDLILLDQRGTGYSEPTLDCPESSDGEDDASDRACHQRLIEAGIDLDGYTTRENAADVETLRLALGIPEWDLLGISYGTRLALEVMRFHPDGLRAVVLDSPFPPNADTPVDEIYSMTDALGVLFSECEADDYCSETYPDLETVFLDTVFDLNADETAPIFGDDLVVALRSAFTDGSLLSLLPWVIYEVAEGNYDAIDEIADSRFSRFQATDVSDSEGMFYSVMCHDEYAIGDYARVEAAVVGTIPEELEGVLLQDTFFMTDTCEYWNPVESVDNTAVFSDIPALVLVGQYDTATPPRWADLTAATLSSGYVFEIPGAGHSVLGFDACVIAIANDFLDDPFSVPNGDCLGEIDWPYFE
jgi:pimeloyl-ACP methyl ester carboxylesterase